MHWKERARWIKFEEDVEEETDRWGKPHVASLSFRSLLELRRTITHGKWRPQSEKKKVNKDNTLFKSPKVDLSLLLTLFLRSHPPGSGAEHSAWNRQSCGGDADDL